MRFFGSPDEPARSGVVPGMITQGAGIAGWVRMAAVLGAAWLSPAPAAEAPADASAKVPWEGHLAGGLAISNDGLRRILDSHLLAGEKGVLKGAVLRGADLNGADLRNANLAGSDLSEANLEGADLYRADLTRAYLLKADLKKAFLRNANLNAAALNGANLANANAYGATLDHAELSEADLDRANLAVSSLQGAILQGTAMNTAYLIGANLADANLSGADLSNADLAGADLRGAKLVGTILTQAIVSDAQLAGAVFELDPKAPQPEAGELASAHGLDGMVYAKAPTALIELRDAFGKAGLSRAASEVNFAIMHGRRLRAGGLEKIGLLAVEIPCGFGLYPARPLKLLLLAVAVFAVPYFVALGVRGKGAIWITWPEDRAIKDGDAERNARLAPRGLRRVGVALYFSLLSAFNIGWEEINIGTWIARIQPREFTLAATGWVRVVAGLQSLFGVYMVALAILSYFGHQFDYT
jgi:hypothetical protein